MSDENKNAQQSTAQSKEKPVNPFGNLNPAEIPTELHTYSYNGKSEKRKKEGEKRGTLL